MQTKRLTNLYDCINDIAKRHEQRGINRAEWFYTQDEFEEIKKDNKNIIVGVT